MQKLQWQCNFANEGFLEMFKHCTVENETAEGFHSLLPASFPQSLH